MATATDPPIAPGATGTERPREATALLLCARPRLDPAQAAHLHGLLAPPATDWPWFLHHAARNALTPLLARHLDGIDAIPRDVAERLASDTRRLSARTLPLTAALRKALAALDAASIPALPYKGPWLAERLYGDLGARPYRDADLIVRPDDRERALAVLKENGFPLVIEDNATPSAYNAKVQAIPGRPERLEIHWAIASPRQAVSLPVDWLFEGTAPTTALGGATVLAPRQSPSLEAEVLALCIHGERHAWHRIIWVADIAALLARGEIDGARLLAMAEERGLRRMTALPMALAERLLGAVPDNPALRSQAFHPWPKRQLDWIVAYIGRYWFHEHPHRGRWSSWRFHLGQREGAGRRRWILANLRGA
ncbi:MAG: nucleotidyltransferase family protein [Sumerlaeia bacterium]